MDTLENERYSRTSQIFVKTILAGGRESIVHYGERFQIVASTGEIQIGSDFSSFKPYRKGTGEKLPSGQRFTRLEIKNETAFDIVAVIWAGFGEYIDTTAELTEAKTVSVARNFPSYTINALASVVLTGNPSGNQIRRKAVVVSNLDNTNSICLLDADGNRMVNVFPLTSVIIPTSSQCTVYNPSASNIGCYISEIFYTV